MSKKGYFFTVLLINHKMDDGNEMILSLSHCLIVKYRLWGQGWWDGYDLLQRTQRLFTVPPSRPDFQPKIWLINTPDFFTTSRGVTRLPIIRNMVVPDLDQNRCNSARKYKEEEINKRYEGIITSLSISHKDDGMLVTNRTRKAPIPGEVESSIDHA
ncbi:hypothetical protein [Kroppenstedtia sanguinis]|uniref:hypothetical protein n=1 Tax=Kroppenstedtia sanguinis TaxID=1380684 RepID=UPI0036D4076A